MRTPHTAFGDLDRDKLRSIGNTGDRPLVFYDDPVAHLGFTIVAGRIPPGEVGLRGDPCIVNSFYNSHNWNREMVIGFVETARNFVKEMELCDTPN